MCCLSMTTFTPSISVILFKAQFHNLLNLSCYKKLCMTHFKSWGIVVVFLYFLKVAYVYLRVSTFCWAASHCVKDGFKIIFGSGTKLLVNSSKVYCSNVYQSNFYQTHYFQSTYCRSTWLKFYSNAVVNCKLISIYRTVNI